MTKKQFRQYLQDHPDVVFDRRTPFHCPLACFLSETYDQVAVVSAEAYITSRLTHRESRKSLPKWARVFIAQVDRDDVPGGGGQVTGAEALALLAA